MKKNTFQNLFRLSAIVVCTLSLSVSAWASTETSSIVICGSETSKEEDEIILNETPEDIQDTADEFVSLGMFTTTGYCNCEQCSGGHSLTYAGTVPQAEHTLSADLNLFPIGTQLMVDGIIYTVEDMGYSVNGNKIDIFYDCHQDAEAHGMQLQEVFALAF